MGPERLQQVLAAAVNDHGALLWQEQLERQERVRAAALPVHQLPMSSDLFTAVRGMAAWMVDGRPTGRSSRGSSHNQPPREPGAGVPSQAIALTASPACTSRRPAGQARW